MLTKTFTILSLFVVCAAAASSELEELEDVEAIYFKLKDWDEEHVLQKRAYSCSQAAASRCGRIHMKCSVWGGGYACIF